MKVHLGVLLTFVENFEEELGKEGKSYHLGYVKKAFAELAKAYIKEARWAHGRQQLLIFVIAHGSQFVRKSYHLGYVKKAPSQKINGYDGLYPFYLAVAKLIEPTTNAFRQKLALRFASEQERVHVASAVQCCIKEYNTTYEEACKVLRGKIAAAWKDLSKECLNPNPVPGEVMKRPLSLAPAIEFYYQCRDGYTDSAFEIKDYITMLLVDPAAVSEQERVHVASAVQCCIKEYNTTYEEACKILQGKISAAWKDLSMECLNPNPVPREVMKRPLNLARVTEFYYQCRDGYTDSAFEIKDYITMLLVDPVAVV
ncbi:hypothetical protein ACLOJK_039521 [Asimina triloba]